LCCLVALLDPQEHWLLLRFNHPVFQAAIHEGLNAAGKIYCPNDQLDPFRDDGSLNRAAFIVLGFGCIGRVAGLTCYKSNDRLVVAVVGCLVAGVFGGPSPLQPTLGPSHSALALDRHRNWPTGKRMSIPGTA
jgi:hypothetical protein